MTSDRTFRAALVACVAVLAVAALAENPRAIGHDQAIYLHCASRLLVGGVPYVDFVDANLPMPEYVDVLPAAIARALRVNPIPVFTVLILALTLLSALATLGLFERMRPIVPRLEAQMLSAAIVVSSALLPVDSFGQPEHWFVLLYLPALTIRVARWTGAAVPPRSAIVWGVAAGLGVCLKPPCLLIVAAVELVGAWRSRSFRSLLAPEGAACVASAFLYVAHFLVVPSASAEALFGWIVPLRVRGYAAFEVPFAQLVRFELRIIVQLGLAWIVFSICRRTDDLVARALTVAALGGLLSFVLQRKAWLYHLVPAVIAAHAVLAVAFAAALQRLDESWPGLRARLVAGVALAILVLFAGRTIAGNWREERQHHAWFTDVLTRLSRPGDRVMIVADAWVPVWPVLLQMDRVSAGRYEDGFPISLLSWIRAHPASWPALDVSAGERRYIDELVLDLSTHRPRLLLISTKECAGCPDGVTTASYLQRHGFFDRIDGQYQPGGPERDLLVFVPRESMGR